MSKKIMKHKPLAGTKITCLYGKRKLSLKTASTYHRGVDMGGPATTLYAVADGKISQKGYNSVRGYFVEIKCKNGFSFFYQHMRSACKLGVGKTVKAGAIIGYKGSTGASTAPHLHFEVRKHGTPVDPVPYFIASFKSTPITHVLSEKYNNMTTQWILENKRLQEQLRRHEFYTGRVDGLFEKQTKKAVGKFQKKYRLKVDYDFGPACRAKAKQEGWSI